MPLPNLNLHEQQIYSNIQNSKPIQDYPNELFLNEINNSNLLSSPFVQQNMMLNINQAIPFTNENNSLRRFNTTATRSNSSSSSNSNSSTNNSVMSNLRNLNISGSNSSSLNILDYDYDYELSSSIKNRNKLFEDDIIFCPRSLLSQSELKTRDEIDKFLLDRYNEYLETNEKKQAPSPHASFNSHIGEQNFNNGPKFNPYASKSFTPSN